ncbi:MAG: hypothetical protein HWE20_03860 [Gammaproteobacteria bacterium]|nr:hypothetical protein [Gammaproteobacteria bacterium]
MFRSISIRAIALLLCVVALQSKANAGYDFNGADKCVIVIASRPTLEQVNEYYFGIPQNKRYLVNVFPSSNNWYAITYGFVNNDTRKEAIAQLVAQGEIPPDSFCASGRAFFTRLKINSSGVSSSGNSSSINISSLDLTPTSHSASGSPNSNRSADCRRLSSRMQALIDEGFNAFVSGHIQLGRDALDVIGECSHPLAIDARRKIYTFLEFADDRLRQENENIADMARDVEERKWGRLLGRLLLDKGQSAGLDDEVIAMKRALKEIIDASIY